MQSLIPDIKGGGLALCSFIWALFGLAVVSGAAGNPPGAPHMGIPAPIRAAMWLAPAALAIVAVWARPLRSPALTLLIAGPLVLASSYLWLWLMFKIPGGAVGRESGWYSAALHAAMIGIVILVACIPHAPVRPRRQDTP